MLQIQDNVKSIGESVSHVLHSDTGVGARQGIPPHPIIDPD